MLFATPDPSAHHQHWQQLRGLALPLAIAEISAASKRLIVVLCDSVHHSQRLEADLNLCLKHRPVNTLHFPSWDTLPYDVFSPNPEIVSERMHFLYQLCTQQTQAVVVMPLSNLMQRIPPKSHIMGRSVVLHSGQKFDLHAQRALLERNGYVHVPEVRENGEMAVRGGLLDLFPGGSEHAYRIELFDDEIESIRRFDPETQRSVAQVDEIRVLPAGEYPFDDAARERFMGHFREQFEISPQKSPIYQDVRKAIRFSGIEQYLPLFHDGLSDLFDYLPEDTLFVHCSDSAAVLRTWDKQIHARHQSRNHDLQRPVLPPAALYLSVDAVLQRLDAQHNLHLNSGVEAPDATFSTRLPPQFNAEAGQSLGDWLNALPQRTLICADSAGRADLIERKLRQAKVAFQQTPDIGAFIDGETTLGLTIAPISLGVQMGGAQPFVVLDEGCLFGKRVNRARQSKKFRINPEDVISNLTDLHLGSPIVHIDHGVGRYRGLKALDYDGESEYLEIEYLGGDKLFVPVASLHLVSRYTGASEESAPWHKLGSDQWSKAKEKAARKIRDVAAELLSLYAVRASKSGAELRLDRGDYEQFCQGFPFEETEDQQRAIDAVLDDLQSQRMMDRVVCGDVGFGKTEVAMRSAFAVANAGRQVALLVPTTLLAQQHYDNFLDRFAHSPIRVELLSRFVAGKKTTEVLKGLELGSVDIVIGTHKLLQKDIRFKQLGLIIIDEEHRFGVRQKERLKQLRADVDILTLTATPIPRTLNTALSGLRDLSIIATPPKARLSVNTQVIEWDESVIREACQREIQRGGQVYFLHNEVQTIERVAESVQKIMPAARVRVAHGQMHEQDLQSVMVDFYKQRFNILVCTTIIESGIDIPTANTILINRADKLGLAQLHQLRGRVGRSHHKAFAFLIIPGWKAISRDAQKRLEALSSLEELGAGFTLATHDMEIRGTGELLGDEQSGQIQTIGFNLYCELLERAVEALKQGQDIDLLQDEREHTEVELNIPALLPEDYIFDVFTRLSIYKRMNNASNEDALDEIRREVIDRFGLLPEAAKNLFDLLKIKLRARELNIRSILMNHESADVRFSDQNDARFAALIRLVQQQPDVYKPLPDNGLRMLQDAPQAQQRIDAIYRLFDILRS